ncbi:AB hydrolase-1 domain-containing protein [Mycena indigotica]|uniref:AB hydrolase-1 domain-containing protein n=1 Tax=Mycena indigotica TaxID=2126181 RepID=A0A8H6S5K2_9AGAR|nr:AB hydrolase-1 domain-containing protein [Mycena indigotica]KAF7292822.1 AB hydrolase-1 domain-containing protein [Mycena indigotica]
MTSTPSKEKLLQLPNDRVLAYEETGDVTSTVLVFFFHGVFGVGRVPKVLSPALIEKRAHYITPTLPGGGNSSPRLKTKPYHVGLAEDTMALIEHLHPGADQLQIYLCGGSYGTVPAQMLYGAPFEIFPAGKFVRGCLLGAPFTPFKHHKGYTRGMTWGNYFSVGPPSQIVPFNLIMRVAGIGVSQQFGGPKGAKKAEKFLQGFLFDGTPEEEKAAFKAWREKQGLEEGQFEREMAENMSKSISKTMAGFIECGDVIHSDWDFVPKDLDDEHTNGRKVVIAASTDDELGPEFANWLKENYKNSSLTWVPGKHISSLFVMDQLFAELLQDA